MSEQKLYRNDSFTEYYFQDDDPTGNKKEKTYIGQKEDDIGLGHDAVEKLNKRIRKDIK